MKKLIVAALLCASVSSVKAMPGTGGYFGHRLIIGVAGSYSPFYSSIGDLFTHADLQGGGELGAIVARRVQVDLFFNSFSLSGNNLYDDYSFGSKDRLQGSQVGITFRRFLGKTGGIAPIGRFIDFSLGYSNISLKVGSDNPLNLLNGDVALPGPIEVVTPSVAFGRQMLVWNCCVIQSGFRFGTDFKTSGSTGNPMTKRVSYKDYFSTFFGIGILL